MPERVFGGCLLAVMLCGCAAPPAHMDAAVLAERERGNTGGTNYGEFGPPDAYEAGSVHPFYGSENEWSRRMFSERAADLYYKRRGQRQMLEIIDGDAERAIELAEARLAADPGDAESYFIVAAASAQLGRIDAALTAAAAALDAGMPAGRFIAGPRELLAPLVRTEAFAALVSADDTAVVHGPLLGDVTDSGARFWIRSAKATGFAVELESAGTTLVVRGRTRIEDDYTGVAVASGLTADTEYAYRIRIGDSVVPPTGVYSFRTAPGRGDAGIVTVGFGGCAGYTPANERMWDTIASHSPRAFLFLGDNVYIDLPEMPGAFHRYSYYQRQSRPEFRRLVSQVPVYAIWDDHDAAFDDVWLGPYVDKPVWKQPMIESFRQNWNNPGHGSATHPGVWFRFAIGDVDFFMLDGRSYRTNPFLESPSMLGPEQLAWLLDGLASSTATFKIIASPVAWADDAKPGSVDTWSGFSREREAIFSAIERLGIGGVVLLSSDRHRSEAWRIERDSGYVFYDLLSGQLTNVHTHPVEAGALFSYNAKDSFGLLSFATDRDDPELRYRIYSIDNELIHTLVIRRSELQTTRFRKK